MSKYSNVFLVGPMGAGKTTVGKYLAANLNMVFKDTDREIESRSGADISWIFDVEGEAVDCFDVRNLALEDDPGGNREVHLQVLDFEEDISVARRRGLFLGFSHCRSSP